MPRAPERPDYFDDYVGRVCRLRAVATGKDRRGVDFVLPAGSRVMIYNGRDTAAPRPARAHGEDDGFRFSGAALTPVGRHDRRGVLCDDLPRAALEPEPGVIDWHGSNQAIAQGWDIFFRDGPNDDGEIWELQAVIDADRFAADQDAWLFVWRRAVADDDPIACQALAFLYYRAPAEYRRIRAHAAAAAAGD